ncbi:hypothetical protein [Frankia sp. Cppng1_Ct_nod]|uniref:hypothetical protein n=1 Tax=Frankia sp. Cppng1_Ct_nod TaxID=2897162 RepID=UPI0015853C12|nr:hypothetical protein [Frankia sp. Cppng1_Ct_nod]
MSVATAETAKDVAVDFEFTDSERDGLAKELNSINANPYRTYDAFLFQVRVLIADGKVPERFVRFSESLVDRDRDRDPVILVKNAPIDRDVPPFDFDEPVRSKYEIKKTFIAEAFLALFAELRKTPGIGYVNVNDGDVFQDIYPKRALSESQSQKALKEIYFHKDLANHFVRPDHVYMLGMRSNPVNEVYTTFVRNIDVIEAFTAEELEQLRRPNFYTPFDDLTVYGGNRELGDADQHPVLSGETDIRYFENRTVGLIPEAEALSQKLKKVLHNVKERVFISPGDFACVYNNHAVHAKEIISIGSEDALRERWIIKSVNVDDLAPHAEHFIPGTDYLVNG